MNLTSSKNWKTAELDQVIDLIIDHRGLTPLKLGGDWGSSGYRALSAKNIKTGEIVQDGPVRFIDTNLYKKWMPVEIERGDILLTSEGPLGEYFLWDSDEKIVLSQRLFGIRTNKKILDPKFFYYLLGTPFYRGELFGRATGTTVEGIRQSELLKTKVIYPESLSDQKEIAEMLGCLDDKIELLRRENKTLEGIAQTLFKSWFVDFNFPGATGKTIDSELGEIPEGWRVGKLGEICKIDIGRTPPRKEEKWFSENSKDVKWVSIKDMGTSGVYIFQTSEYLTQEAVDNFNVPVIPENTVIISFKMTLGRVAITTEKMLSNEAIAHLKLKNELSQEFLYLAMKSFDFNSLGSTSSIVSAVNSQSIKGMEIVIPNEKIVSLFNQTIKPVFGKLKINAQEIKNLSKLRNDLLNKIFNI